jgi:hypothetical protein
MNANGREFKKIPRWFSNGLSNRVAIRVHWFIRGFFSPSLIAVGQLPCFTQIDPTSDFGFNCY